MKFLSNNGSKLDYKLENIEKIAKHNLNLPFADKWVTFGKNGCHIYFL